MPKPFLLSLPGVAALGLCVFPVAQASAQDIAVGEYASLTGGNATFGTSSHAGTALAIDEVNAKGGVLNGQKLKLLTEDDQSKAGEPANIVKKFISNDKVAAVLGEVASSKSLEAAPICQTASIPMISPASTNPKVTQIGDFIFRVCFLDEFQGKCIARFAATTLKAKKAGVLIDVKQDYSTGLAGFIKDNFTQAGGTIVAEKSYSSGDKDFKAQLTSIKAAQPDVIFVPGYYTEVSEIARQARSTGHQGAAHGRRRVGFRPSRGQRRHGDWKAIISPTISRARTTRRWSRISSRSTRRSTATRRMPWRRWVMIPR